MPRDVFDESKLRDWARRFDSLRAPLSPITQRPSTHEPSAEADVADN